VVADVAKLSVGREEYYTLELATDHVQYLSGHGESPGRCYGAGATSLGLQGEASSASFRRMFEGRHPDTGELLGRGQGRNAVPAFDVVLRPTKGVSILYGLGDAATGRAVLDAHCRRLARLHRAGELVAIRVPSVAEEAVRDLCRARADLLADRTRARHRLSKFLLRHGRVWRGGATAWTVGHERWLYGQQFDDPR
jgi:hypothetical protein